MAGRYVEIGLRFLSAASGAGALVAGSITVNRLISISQDAQNFIDQITRINVTQYTQASGGLAIALGALGLFLAVTSVFRIGNFKLGVADTVILVLDLVLTFLCFSGLVAGGVIGAIGANSWTLDVVDLINSLPPFFQPAFNLIVQTRDALAATAAVSLFASLLFGALGIWMIVLFAVGSERGRFSYKGLR